MLFTSSPRHRFSLLTWLVDMVEKTLLKSSWCFNNFIEPKISNFLNTWPTQGILLFCGQELLLFWGCRAVDQLKGRFRPVQCHGNALNGILGQNQDKWVFIGGGGGLKGLVAPFWCIRVARRSTSRSTSQLPQPISYWLITSTNWWIIRLTSQQPPTLYHWASLTIHIGWMGTGGCWDIFLVQSLEQERKGEVFVSFHVLSFLQPTNCNMDVVEEKFSSMWTKSARLLHLAFLGPFWG